jgi:hypothetical protein
VAAGGSALGERGPRRRKRLGVGVDGRRASAAAPGQTEARGQQVARTGTAQLGAQAAREWAGSRRCGSGACAQASVRLGQVQAAERWCAAREREQAAACGTRASAAGAGPGRKQAARSEQWRAEWPRRAGGATRARWSSACAVEQQHRKARLITAQAADVSRAKNARDSGVRGSDMARP